MKRAALLALLAPLLGACASTMPRAPEPLGTLPAEARADLTVATQELDRLTTELDGLAAQAAPPTCARVVALRDNICTLAERICRLADQYPAEPTLVPRCKDARQRCARAAEAVKQRGCGSG